MLSPAKKSATPLSIREKIKLAQNLYVNWGEALLEDFHIHRLLARLKKNIEDTNKAVLALGIYEVCKHCEEEEGSCCGAGIENKYDVVILLINIAMGIHLPTQRYQSNSCYFLNKNGCILKARHVLCVNYLCSKIKQTFTLDELIRIQYLAGNELDTLFILHEAIKKFINNDGQRLPKRNYFADYQLL